MKDANWELLLSYALLQIKEHLLFSHFLKFLSRLYPLTKLFPVQSKKLNVKVISVGNIVCGGTGKTPFVEYLVNLLKGKVQGLGLVTSGYGGSKRIGIFTDGRRRYFSWKEGGDETELLAKKVKGVPIGFGKNRLAVIELLENLFDTKIIILDDGFQYRGIEKDMEILLIDARKPFGDGYFIPYGYLRDSWRSIKRADLVVITKFDSLSIDRETIAFLKKKFPHIPFLWSYHSPQCLWKGKEKIDLSFLYDREIISLCAIGDPEYFEETLERLGAKIEKRLRFPDHYPFHEKEIETLLKNTVKKKIIITTEKDYLKIPESIKKSFPIYFLEVKMKFYEGEEKLWEKLKEKGIC
ncbi:tetraacyldisaccharide 4'-kinase [Candidatus Calescamantes bacterium]|nr:tetraacyldisaccharide 4'-kinase [Candidatus Calescamantes bacterium]